LSESKEAKTASWSTLSDALLKADQPDKAARSLAEVYKLQPNNKQLLGVYTAAKRQQGKRTHSAMAITKERPLTRKELVRETLASYGTSLAPAAATSAAPASSSSR
jgi:hypothetical protein